MSKLNLFIVILIAGALIISDQICTKNNWKMLRSQHLTESVEGTITKISKSKYGTTVYSYSYKVDGNLIKSIYKMTPRLEGIKTGSPVKVIYLRESPRRSRLVWIEEDFEWIE